MPTISVYIRLCRLVKSLPIVAQLVENVRQSAYTSQTMLTLISTKAF